MKNEVSAQERTHERVNVWDLVENQ
jgi:hypothetical protein